MKELDFILFEKEVRQLLSHITQMSLATCNNNKVTARTIFVICKDFDILFLTKRSYNKYKQILKNPNVALCVDNIQIEGIAYIKGHPQLEENKKFVDYCLENGYESFKRYMKNKTTALIQVEPKLITLWKGNGREYLDLDKQTAYRVG